MISERLENVTQTISRLLEGYDIRLRPNFGGKRFLSCFLSLKRFQMNFPVGFTIKLWTPKQLGHVTYTVPLFAFTNVIE